MIRHTHMVQDFLCGTRHVDLVGLFSPRQENQLGKVVAMERVGRGLTMKKMGSVSTRKSGGSKLNLRILRKVGRYFMSVILTS